MQIRFGEDSLRAPEDAQSYEATLELRKRLSRHAAPPDTSCGS